MKPFSENPVMNFFCKILLAEKCLPLIFKNRKAITESNKKIPSIQPKEKKCCDCATD